MGRHPSRLGGAVWLGAACIGSAAAAGPDVIVGELFEVFRWGSVDGVVAYSVGTDSCNVGDEPLPWIAETAEHPVIAQNLYRLENGRIEQLGMSWVKHGFGALQLETCGDCDPVLTLDALGVGCSDPYTAGLNGDQRGFFGIAGLGPRSEVNPSTGEFPFPYGSQGQGGDDVYKRLQVRESDLDAALHPDARYFVEGHYVQPDDAQAGNGANNVSHREVSVDGDFDLALIGQTRSTLPAILAWAEADPEVQVSELDLDGRLILASRATPLDGGGWQYEYALYNLNSHRGIGGFTVPLGPAASPTRIGFHDVDYHSGEPYSGDDWPGAVTTVGDFRLRWATDRFQVDPDANALRWGTLYNFRFQSTSPPAPATITLEPFRPGQPSWTSAAATAPCAPAGPYDLELEQSELVRGRPVTFTVRGAAAGEEVAVLRSASGVGCGACPPALGGRCLGLLGPFEPIGRAVADATGVATLTLTLPAGIPDGSVGTQAVVVRGGGAIASASNPLAAPIVDP